MLRSLSRDLAPIVLHVIYFHNMDDDEIIIIAIKNNLFWKVCKADT